MFIGNAGGNDTTTINLQYVPQWIQLEDITNVDRVTVTDQGGGVILDLDSNGLLAFSIADKISIDNGGTNGPMYPLALSLIPNRTCQVQVINSGVSNKKVYASSLSKGLNAYLKSFSSPVLASSQNVFSDFKLLALDYAIMTAAGTYVVIETSDGTINRFEPFELLNLLQTLQVSYGQTPQSYLINNTLAWLKSVTVYSGSAGNAYVQRMVKL